MGTLTGRSGEIAEVLERRRVKACCGDTVERRRGKGDKNSNRREIYKLLWKGCAEGLNGVGVIMAEEFIDKVVKVVRY